MASNFSFQYFSRRDVLRVLSGAALSVIGGRLVTAAPSSSGNAAWSALTPELTEGPYYIDLERIRRDITEGKTGLPMQMQFKVVHVTTGAPISGAAVDVWHCDAQGVYSGFNSHGPPPGPPPFMGMDDDFAGYDGSPPGGPPGGPGFGPEHEHKPDNNQTFLRGVQITNAGGVAKMDTIYPGWYGGRTTHIHVRVHLGGVASDGRYQGGHISHTGQIFFPEDATDKVYRLKAYSKSQQGRTPLQDDGIFNQGGALSMAQLSLIDPQRFEAGYISDTLLIIDPAATPRRA
jgi:protocatechuate 3,4-dioxygenase beta subunit